MDLALDAPTLIPQFAPFAFEQIIIAGGDEDIAARGNGGGLLRRGRAHDWAAPFFARLGFVVVASSVTARSGGLLSVRNDCVHGSKRQMAA